MKALLIIPMAIIEIVLLGMCWMVALTHKPVGRKLVEWSIKTLPSKEWYS